jgi:hypothetical protein
VDGTCILDVKPFIPSYDAPIGEIDLPTWAAMRAKDDLGVSFSDKAEMELDKIIASGIMPSVMNSWDEVKAALVQVLAAGHLESPSTSHHLALCTSLSLSPPFYPSTIIVCFSSLYNSPPQPSRQMLPSMFMSRV